MTVRKTHPERDERLAAIADGQVKLVTRWQTEGVRVELEIAGGDGVIQTLRTTFEPN